MHDGGSICIYQLSSDYCQTLSSDLLNDIFIINSWCDNDTNLDEGPVPLDFSFFLLFFPFTRSSFNACISFCSWTVTAVLPPCAEVLLAWKSSKKTSRRFWVVCVDIGVVEVTWIRSGGVSGESMMWCAAKVKLFNSAKNMSRYRTSYYDVM